MPLAGTLAFSAGLWGLPLGRGSGGRREGAADSFSWAKAEGFAASWAADWGSEELEEG